MYASSRKRALLLTLLVMVGDTLISALVGGRYAQQRALAAESAQVQRQLGLYAQTLQQRMAMAQGRGHFYGIGMTTAVPGYFISQAIRDNAGRAIGVIAIKIELRALEQEWLQSTDIVLTSDAHDVVFLANGDQWRYRLLRPLAPAERAEMLANYVKADASRRGVRTRPEIFELRAQVHF